MSIRYIMVAAGNCLLISLVSVLSICVVKGEATVCSDSPILNCTEAKRLKPDLCTVQCLAGLCNQTCGLCPTASPAPQFQCFHCSDVDRPDQCTTTQHCNQSQSCIVTQTINANLEKKFQLGCVDDQICTDLYSTQLVQQNQRSILYYGHCCKESNCNNKEPELLQARSRRTSDDGACHDINNNFCRDLRAHHGCTNDCVSRYLCPFACNFCLVCFKCDFVTKPEYCKHREHCLKGEQCSVEETQDKHHGHGYKLGCSSETQCQHIHSSNRHDNPNSYCCSQRFCNHGHITTITTTRATTTETTTTSRFERCTHHHRRRNLECPPNFNKISPESTCYYFHDKKMTQHNAANLCHKMCGRLVVPNSKSERINLTVYIREHMDNLHLQMNHEGSSFWTDGIKSGRGPSNDNDWKWPSLQRDARMTEIHWRHGSPDGHRTHNGEHCLNFGPSEGINHNEFYSDDKDCSNQYFPLCEYNPTANI